MNKETNPVRLVASFQNGSASRAAAAANIFPLNIRQRMTPQTHELHSSAQTKAVSPLPAVMELFDRHGRPVTKIHKKND
jgi:hypothetical protein